MGMTAAGMKAAIIAARPAAVQTNDPAAAAAYADAQLLALCQGIINHIQAAAVVTTSDAQGGTNTGTVA